MASQVIDKVSRVTLTEGSPNYQLAPGEAAYVDVQSGVQGAVFLPDSSTCEGAPCAVKAVAGFAAGATLTVRPAQSSSDAVDEMDGLPVTALQSFVMRAASPGFWYVEAEYTP